MRSDSVRNLSDDGWRAVVDYGVRTVLDLRFDLEREDDPPRELPVDVVHLSLFGELDEAWWNGLDARAAAAGSPVAATQLVYTELLELRGPEMAAAVTTVAEAPPGAVLVHCVGGKDRTGLVSAFLLRLAGVAVDDIAADYALSAEYLAPRHEQWIAGAADEAERERMRRIAATPAESMQGRAGGRRGPARRRRRLPPRRRRHRGGARGRPRPAARLDPMAHVVAIFGPTASGKTDVAEALADRLGGEVVSADAMQVYRGLPILTNQPERPTRLVGMWPLSHEASVAEYAALAHEAIDEILAAGRTPVVAGGTGLYLRAALADLDVPPAPAPGARERWAALYDARGAEAAHAELAERDPAAAAAVHPNDRRRVVRALELAEAGSSLRPARGRLWTDDTRHPTAIFGLDVPKDVLERRIVERNRRMVERGVEEEVRRALAGPLSATARHVHGLRELAELPLRGGAGRDGCCRCAATPPTSASGCGASRGSCASTPTGRRVRPPTRFSSGCALGNRSAVERWPGDRQRHAVARAVGLPAERRRRRAAR